MFWDWTGTIDTVMWTERKMDFSDRDAAMVWIIDNQLGRRNLILYDTVTLQDKRRSILAKQATAKRIEGNAKGGKSDKISCSSSAQTRQEKRENSTDYKIAKAAGTSEDTVRKVRAIEDSNDEHLKQQVRSGEAYLP